MSINFRDNFESVYIREDYFRKMSTFDTSYMEEFGHIINHTALLVFNMNKRVISSVGFNYEDFSSISNIYALYYFNLYGFKVNTEAMNRYVLKYKSKNGPDSYPSKEEISKKERNNLINFLRQKLFHCVTVFSRKRRNIIVDRDFKIIIAQTEDSIRADVELIIKDPKKFGYSKVTNKSYSGMLKNSDTTLDGVYNDQGFRVSACDKKGSGITSEDFKTIAYDDNAYFNDPEAELSRKEDEAEFQLLSEDFDRMSKKQKRAIVKSFIRANHKNKLYKNEIKIARSFLNNEDTWYNQK